MAVFSSGFFAEWLKDRLLCNQFPYRPPSVVQFFLIFFKSRQTGFNLLIFFFWIVEVEQRAMKNCSRWKMSQCDCYRFIICFIFYYSYHSCCISLSLSDSISMLCSSFSYSLSQFTISSPHSSSPSLTVDLLIYLLVSMYESTYLYSFLFIFLSMSLSSHPSFSFCLSLFLPFLVSRVLWKLFYSKCLGATSNNKTNGVSAEKENREPATNGSRERL